MPPLLSLLVGCCGAAPRCCVPPDPEVRLSDRPQEPVRSPSEAVRVAVKPEVVSRDEATWRQEVRNDTDQSRDITVTFLVLGVGRVVLKPIVRSMTIEPRHVVVVWPGAFGGEWIARVRVIADNPTTSTAVLHVSGAPVVTNVPTGTRIEMVRPVIQGFLFSWAVAEGSEVDAATGFPRRIRRKMDSAVMVLIPAGTFQMGSAPRSERSYNDEFHDELPRHWVTLSKAYYLDETEVTVAMWKAYVNRVGGAMPRGLRPDAGDSHPIHSVSWNEIQDYLSWTTTTLPTEAQWERAAKGGHDEFVFPWGSRDDRTRRPDRLAAVKQFAPNEYGVFDLGGNAFEWCADAYDGDYYAKSPVHDPTGPVAASSRVVRGGTWHPIDWDSFRASYRDEKDPSSRHDLIGFRCARTLP